MSKYIRLKDGTIWDDGNNYIIDEEGNYCEVRTFMGRSEEVIMIPKDNIEKESDNLEDLCDVFVKKSKEEGNDFFDIGTNMFRIFDMKYYDYKKWFGVYDYYGAIWTNKGLIFVAKMNEDGELELI